MFISVKKDIKSYMYEYYIPEGETKKKAETSLWVVHLTQPVNRALILSDTWSHVATTPLHVWMVGSVG